MNSLATRSLVAIILLFSAAVIARNLYFGNCDCDIRDQVSVNNAVKTEYNSRADSPSRYMPGDIMFVDNGGTEVAIFNYSPMYGQFFGPVSVGPGITGRTGYGPNGKRGGDEGNDGGGGGQIAGGGSVGGGGDDGDGNDGDDDAGVIIPPGRQVTVVPLIS